MEPESHQDQLNSGAVDAPGLQEAPQQEVEAAAPWTPPAGEDATGTTVSCLPDRRQETGDAEVLYDDVPAETGHRTLDSDRCESVLTPWTPKIHVDLTVKSSSC